MDVIGGHIPLRRQGKIFVGPCAWHESKSRRSFVVSPDHGSWRCWGCDIGGDVFQFVQKFLDVNFRDAVSFLARRAGIDLTAAPSRELETRVAERAALDAARRQMQERERDELRRLSKELSDARRLQRAAIARLGALERGVRPRFEGEANACCDAIALATEELRDLDVSYCVVAFGARAARERFITSPESRDEMIAAALDAGFVEDERGRRVGVPRQ